MTTKNEIHLYGSVGSYWWDEDYFTANSVRAALENRSGPLTVRINSGGGIASEGQAIYTMLVDYPDEVHVVVDGVAASAASLIAMAGDTITMRLGSYMLIHDPACPYTEGRGTETDHLKLAQQLAVTSGAYAAIYALKSGKSRVDAREVMKAETLFDGDMAVAAGFATDTDETTQAAAVARYDYRMYAHAPQAWRDASEGLGVAPARTAMMAMMAGQPRSKPKEKNMTDKTADKAKADVSAGTGDDDVKTETPPVVATPDETAVARAAAVAERARALRIRETVAMAKLDVAVADDLIVRGVGLDSALDQIMAKWKGEGDVDKPMQGREPAKILRDERDTRNTGMAVALAAQMRGKAPADDKAMPYMDMSLVDMAAVCADYRGSIRSPGDKIRVFEMAAGHSRSDFPGIFENALNKTLLERYEVQQPTYRSLARKRNFNDFRAHPMVRVGDFPKPQLIGESGEIKFGTFGEKRETAILSSYAVGLRFTRQMMIDDDLSAIDDMVADYGSRLVDFEEELFYSFMATAVLASDGGAVWQTSVPLRGGNLAAAGTAITIASLAAGRAVMRKQVSIPSTATATDGVKMNLAPAILLVGPDKETEAEQLIASIVPNQVGSVNPFARTLQVVSSAQITGNKWYLFADPTRGGGACFVYGYLNGAEAPRLRTEELFGHQGMAMTLEMDFGLGANDFRGTYQNPGA